MWLALNQLNLWTMDGFGKKCHCSVCLKEIEQMETCKEFIRNLLKDCGFQNITIEVDADLETHQAHKRNITRVRSKS